MLFLLFFNDFVDFLRYRIDYGYCNVVQFADDAVIYLSSKSIVEIDSKLN